MYWSAAIDACLRAGGPTIVFQPICELWDGRRAVGYEALSRFDAGTPDEWFQAAWSLGRGVDLELAALRAALRLLDQIPTDCYLSVNVSHAALNRSESVEILAGHSAERIQLEVTEHVFIADIASLQELLAPLRKAGMRVAIDDFGSGHSTLREAVQFHPDTFKTDRWLATQIDSPGAWRQRAALASIIQLASRLDVTVVAEGIETDGEAETVYLLGVQYGQGYLLGRGDTF